MSGVHGAVDTSACKRLTRTGRLPGIGGGLCYCQPACAVCGQGIHAVVHGPEYGEGPGSRPWHHEYVKGAGTPDYSDANAWDWREHPRQDWTEDGELDS